jgi:hypothetical protein
MDVVVSSYFSTNFDNFANVGSDYNFVKSAGLTISIKSCTQTVLWTNPDPALEPFDYCSAAFTFSASGYSQNDYK